MASMTYLPARHCTASCSIIDRIGCQAHLRLASLPAAAFNHFRRLSELAEEVIVRTQGGTSTRAARGSASGLTRRGASTRPTACA